MNSLDPTGARRIALSMVLAQTVVTVLIAAAFLIGLGAQAAISALVGGGIGAAAGLAMVAFMFRRTAGNDPRHVVRNAYKGEAAKLGLTVVLFVAAFRFLELSALPLFVAYIATLAVHWVALLRKTKL